MKMLLTKDPAIWAYLMPWYVPTDQSRLEIGLKLFELLTTNPDDTYVSIAVEDGNVEAVLIAFVDNETDVMLWQARNKSGFQYSRSMLDALIDWAKEKNKSRIIAITERNTKPFERKYGFVPIDGRLVKEI